MQGSSTWWPSIAGDKMILRERRAVRAFLRDAQARDRVRIERLDIDRFRYTPMLKGLRVPDSALEDIARVTGANRRGQHLARECPLVLQ